MDDSQLAPLNLKKKMLPQKVPSEFILSLDAFNKKMGIKSRTNAMRLIAPMIKDIEPMRVPKVVLTSRSKKKKGKTKIRKVASQQFWEIEI